jgi:uncharacterized membrane protein
MVKAFFVIAVCGLLLGSVAAADGGEPEGLSRGVRFLGKFHPLAVHFPVALILAAVLAEFLLVLTSRRGFAEASHFAISTGALGAIVAIALGLAAGAYAGYSGKYADTLALHRGLGIAAGACAVLAAVFSILSRREKAGPRLVWVYRVALLASAALVGATGHLGATLVYGFDLLKW